MGEKTGVRATLNEQPLQRSEPRDLGGWAVGIKDENKARYEELKARSYKGLSMAGVADRVETVSKSAAGGGCATQTAGWFARVRAALGIGKETNVDELKKAIEEMAKTIGKIETRVNKLGEADPGAGAGSADLKQQLDGLEKRVKALTEKNAAAEKSAGSEALAKRIADALAKGKDAKPEDLAKEIAGIVADTGEGTGADDLKKQFDALKADVAKMAKETPGSQGKDAKAEKGKGALGLL